jgi:hypothetical protein
MYVARQMGNDPRLTLTTYGHVIDELEDAPRRMREPRVDEMVRETGSFADIS